MPRRACILAMQHVDLTHASTMGSSGAGDCGTQRYTRFSSNSYLPLPIAKKEFLIRRCYLCILQSLNIIIKSRQLKNPLMFSLVEEQMLISRLVAWHVGY